MAEKNEFHLSDSAAENYERQKVPAIFAPMAEATLNAISLPRTGNVLDVACGTGIVARAVAKRLAEPGRIAGIDLNPAMIGIARRNTSVDPHDFEWISGSAAAMPFDDATFDLVFCQQGLQFFPNKQAALTEIRRVTRNGGRLVVTCWAAIPPFFRIVAEVLRRHIDEAAATKAIAPFLWNDRNRIGSLIADAGFDCQPGSVLPVVRVMAASPEAMRQEILATPNEPALRAAGDGKIDQIVSEILASVAHFRKGQALAMPQEALLFEAVAR